MLLFIHTLCSCYATRLALQFNNQFNSRRPIGALLQDPKTPKKLKQELKFCLEILDFAQDRGLNTKGAYKYLILNQDKPVSYLVQVAEPLKLQFLTWWYPFVGSVPYRGFFVKDERDKESQKWKKLGYDVSNGQASAFSSLGWFEDPLYQSMLRRSRASFCLIFCFMSLHIELCGLVEVSVLMNN